MQKIINALANMVGAFAGLALAFQLIIAPYEYIFAARNFGIPFDNAFALLAAFIVGFVAGFFGVQVIAHHTANVLHKTGRFRGVGIDGRGDVPRIQRKEAL